MATLNKILLIGNMTRDPELKYTPGGQAVALFGLATNRTWKDQKTGEKREEVTFFDCEVWGKTAESLGKWFTKGTGAFIEGRMKQDIWDDKETGKKRSKMKVVCERISFSESKRGGAPVPTPQPATRGDELPEDGPELADGPVDSNGNSVPF